MNAEPGYAGGYGETRHQVPKCQSCGWVGPWKVESLLLPHHIIIGLIFLFAFGGGLIYLLIVLITRSNENNRAKICPNCGARNMHTFVYAEIPGAQAGYSAAQGAYPQGQYQPQAQYAAAPYQAYAPSAAAPPTMMAPSGSAAAAPARVLRLNEAPMATLSLVPGSRWSVGRSPTCQLVMSDALVSGTHAHIKVHSDRSVSIEDCGSSNGTFVNGQRLTAEYRLEPGDVVHLGGDSTRLSLDPA